MSPVKEVTFGVAAYVPCSFANCSLVVQLAFVQEYTQTKSYPASVAKEVNVMVLIMDDPGGTIIHLHAELLL
jgi:hypothetical protein